MNSNVKVLRNYNKVNVENTDFNLNTSTYVFKFIKRSFDIFVGVCGSVCVVPIAFFITIANRLHKDKAPIIYKQDRIRKKW